MARLAFRYVVATGFCLALGVGVILAAPLVFELLGWTGLADQMSAAQAEGHRLDDLGRRVHDRLVRKTAVAEGVARGRMGLLPAAAAFRDLAEGEGAESWQLARLKYQGATEEERFCRAVTGFAEAVLFEESQPPPKLIIDRLNRELEGHIRAGTLVLPRQSPAGP